MEGCRDGLIEGCPEGSDVGLVVGWNVGKSVGRVVGRGVGREEGFADAAPTPRDIVTSNVVISTKAFGALPSSKTASRENISRTNRSLTTADADNDDGMARRVAPRWWGVDDPYGRAPPQ